MEFRAINTRSIVLIVVVVIFMVAGIVSGIMCRRNTIDDGQARPAPVPTVLAGTTAAVRIPVVNEQQVIADNEEQRAQQAMKEQMERDRDQQRQIKMLKMQLEQVDLQLDNEKALTEINKLKKENAGYVKDSSASMGADFPSIRVIYIGGTTTDKKAILSIDGTSYSVRTKDKPVANIEVVGVSDQGVKVHLSAPQDLTTVINYVQD